VSINSKDPSQGQDGTTSADAVEELVSAGKYGEAAAQAESHGDFRRAAELFERVWDFASAARCAEGAGDLARALKNALDARADAETKRLTDALSASGESGQRAALEVLSQKRHFAAAAPLAEGLGERERAIALYQGAHRELDAARLLEDVGRDDEAGRLLEKLVEHSDLGDERAHAHLRLGRLLARRLRHEEAIRHLQEATRDDSTAGAARLLLVVELAALGLRDAARDVLIEARRHDPDLPLDLDEVIRTARPAASDRPEFEIIGGRYRLEEMIGSGAAGRVFRARDEVTGRRVAVKLFSTSYVRGHDSFERFVREARIASALKHPNLVEAYDFSADNGYLVMEYMTGGSLASRLGRHLEPSTARRMALDILGGLELAHRRGIVHRDVKPANIFFDARGTAKLGDFGVAHLIDLGQTQTGGLIGTLAYMSPEQITGAPLTVAADLYSLGVTLFEALTGRLPFQGPDFVAEHLGSTPPRPSEIDSNLAAGWDPIIASLLEKSPSERCDSIDELRRALLHLDLGSAAHKPLILPRARASARRSAVTEPPPTEATPPEEQQETERYEFETALRTTTSSSLSRAVDTALGRSVIIERFQEPLDADSERRLLALAQGGGPFLQRALSYDRSSGTVVFEAPSGAPLADVFAQMPLEPRSACRLLKRIARALAPVHASGRGHGALSSSTILIDEFGYPTVIISGVEADPASAPAADLEATRDLVADVLGTARSWPDLVATLAPTLAAGERDEILALCPPTDDQALYAVADALEIAILRH